MDSREGMDAPSYGGFPIAPSSLTDGYSMMTVQAGGNQNGTYDSGTGIGSASLDSYSFPGYGNFQPTHSTQPTDQNPGFWSHPSSHHTNLYANSSRAFLRTLSLPGPVQSCHSLMSEAQQHVQNSTGMRFQSMAVPLTSSESFYGCDVSAPFTSTPTPYNFSSASAGTSATTPSLSHTSSHSNSLSSSDGWFPNASGYDWPTNSGIPHGNMALDTTNYMVASGHMGDCGRCCSRPNCQQAARCDLQNCSEASHCASSLSTICDDTECQETEQCDSQGCGQPNNYTDEFSAVCQDNQCDDSATACYGQDCLPESANTVQGEPMAQQCPLGNNGSPMVWQGNMEPSAVYPPFAHSQPCNHTNAEHDALTGLIAVSAREPGSAVAKVDDQGITNMSAESTLSPRVVSMEPSPATVSATDDNDALGPKICAWMTGEEQFCNQTFDDVTALHNHVQTHHIASQTKDDGYFCHWHGCGRAKNFASRNKIERHVTTHTKFKSHECQRCLKTFSAKQALDQHVRIHTGEHPFECSSCGKRFKQKSALTMHERTHSGEKPLKCEVCSKRFSESSNLAKHRKTHGLNCEYHCDVAGCGKMFKRKDQLKRHKAIHENSELGSRRAKARAQLHAKQT